MKWGALPGDSRDLLYWVLWFVIGTYSDLSVDSLLKRILVCGGGASGDPGWEIEHVPGKEGGGHYHVWADPDMSGIEPAETNYSVDMVRQSIKESLFAFAEAHPDKAAEIERVIANYSL